MEEELLLIYIYQEEIYVLDEPTTPVEQIDKTGSSSSVPASQESVSNQLHEPEPVKQLGNNDKGILILVHDEKNEFLDPGSLSVLMKIIESGLKYGKNDIALVNCAKYSVDQIMDEVPHLYLLAFGIKDLPDEYTHSTYSAFDHDDRKILLADDLKSLEPDRSKKGQLWNALQSMFNL